MNLRLLRCFLVCLLPLVFAACDARTDVKALQTETERLHDEAMEIMTDMSRVGRELKKEYAALDSLSTRRDSLATVLQRIETAENDMFAWMSGYEAPDQKKPEEAIVYLHEQKAKIEKNLQDIRSALDAGKEMIRVK